jgi:DNA-binding transcriptional LysR family regulator
MRYFLAVGEELNFRKAAERMHIAQPSLSVQIQQMEDEIGTPLLERNTHQVALTAAGSEFLESCRRLLRDVEDSKQKALRIARGDWGQLSIGFVASLGYQLLPKTLQAYRSKFPDVELQLLEMDTSRQLKAIEDHRLDLGFIGLGQSEKLAGLEVTPVTQERLFAVVPQNHPLAKPANEKGGVALHSFANEVFLLAEAKSAPLFNPWLKVLCHQSGFHPRVIQESGQTVTVLNYVAAGLGITILPAQYRHLAIAGVSFLPLVRPIVYYHYYAAWLPQNKYSALHMFIKIARQVARSEAGIGRSQASDEVHDQTATVESIPEKLTRCRQSLEQIPLGCISPKSRKQKVIT